MKETLSLSKYLLISAVIHGGVLGGWIPSSAPWSGLAQTQIVQNPMQIATLELRPSAAAEKVRPDFLAPNGAKKSGRTFSARAAVSYHGVHVADTGVAEIYTSRLHAALQRHFHHLFADMPVTSPVVFNLHLEIDRQGMVTSANAEPTGYVRGDYVQRMMVAVRELKTLPAPPETRPFVVPVSFKP